MDPDVPPVDENDECLGNSPIVMLLGSIAGLLIVGGTVFLRKYKRKVEMDRDSGGDY